MADGRPPRPRPRRGRSSATRRSRRGRCPAESAAARAEALEGKPVHEFHLSTNYRNSAEIYEFAAAYAERVGLDADLPTAVRSTGVEPREVTGVDRPRGRDPRGGRSTWPARSRGTVGIVVPVARRSEVNAWLASWPELADDAPGARAAVDSSVAPSGEDRVVVLTGLDTKGLEFDGIVVVRPEEIEAESATGRSTLYVVLTRATQLLTDRQLTVAQPRSRSVLPEVGDREVDLASRRRLDDVRRPTSAAAVGVDVLRRCCPSRLRDVGRRARGRRRPAIAARNSRSTSDRSLSAVSCTSSRSRLPGDRATPAFDVVRR